ncbi:MAG: HU family DNA-binding protein [Bacteroidaceae bacterium]|nr:HU family DNA-binding protein [Bacteroidaceae bacterium]
MDMKLNHSDLSALLAKEAGISVAKSELFTKAFFDLVIEGLESDGIVKINGLGTFKITDVASRSSVNVNTGEKFEIKGHKKLSFLPADTLKDNVNQPFAMFEPVEVDDTYSDEEIPDSTDEAEENVPVEDIEAEDAPQAETADALSEAADNDTAVEESAGVAPAAEQDVEEVVAVQERPVEPVMVRVPKKESKKPVEKRTKSHKWLYMTLSIIVIFSLAAVLYFYYFNTMPAEEQAAAVPVQAIESPAINAEEKPAVADSVDAVTAATVDATTGATPQDKALSNEEQALSDIVPSQENKKVYEFVMIEELSSLPLKDITLSDTHLYDIAGEWKQHKVAAGETLTKIALIYYGDKKLWPYIVKHNSMSRPDDLSKGMTISIPMLEPRR